ncbi:hypothetical protein AJ78_05013 [Emergomyces pasteurianus Ep9510]|uniref:Rho-GAP domain-containing protein n=1 Tax=Emergomyces pasteurianus Ep9510 TaxID=1447872 RepID=A0A1J9QFE1_9EURO|nr:hypothetical protein AJ78_05013 [Emergomyces pasteurianus Ep9510]
MGFSEALRYLSRFYRRGSKHKQNSTTSPVQTDLAPNDPTCVQTGPTAIASEPGQEDLQVEGDPVRSASDHQILENQPSQGIQEIKGPIEPVKKANTPSKSPFENLQIEKSGGRSRGSPIRSLVSDSSKHEISPANRITSETRDEDYKCVTGPAERKHAYVESEMEHNPSQSTRQSSNQTLLSDKSCATVQHDPSKRCRSPIATIDFRIPSENDSPFSDRHAIPKRPDRTSSDDVFKPSGKLTIVEHGPNSCSSNAPHRSGSGGWQPAHAPVPSRISSHSSNHISNRIVSGTLIPQRDTLRVTALNRLSISFEFLGIVLPTKSQETNRNSEPEDDLPKGSNSLLGRIRSVKSNLGLNRKNSGRRVLRRIQTFANLETRYSIGELKGKSLEDLARLGGLGYLNLPEGYGPRTLVLPICFASAMRYLLEHGTGVDDLHDYHVDNEVVCSLYSKYANQVLSAAMIKDTIDKTTRAARQPTALVPPADEPTGNNVSFVHDVSTVFRHLLCGIPGGILGSTYLCEVLQKIQKHHFEPSSVVKDPYRNEYHPNFPPPTAAKIRLIALALAALSNDMQLELICSVFGLLSFTVDENAKLRNSPNYTDNSCHMLPDSNSLDAAFSFVLVDPKSIGFTADENNVVKDPEINHEGVVKMIIDHWKDIYVQLARMGAFS